MWGPEAGSPGFTWAKLSARLRPALQSRRKGPWSHPATPSSLGHPGQSLGLSGPLQGDEGAEALVNRVIEAADFQLIEEEGAGPGMALLWPSCTPWPTCAHKHTHHVDVDA